VTVTPSDATDAPDHDLEQRSGPSDGSTAAPEPVSHGGGAAPARRRWRWPSWLAVELHDDGPTPPVLTAVVVACVVVGIGARFATRSHLWLDEALSANIAALPIGEIPEALEHDGHPPLYYVLLHVWREVVGTSDVAVRAFSGVVSLATLPLAYVAGRRAGGRLLGLLALVVFSLSPFTLRYATETRMYALVTFGVLVGYLLLDDLVRRGRRGLVRLVGLALVGAGLLWTHYWSLWLLGGTVLVLAWMWRRASTDDRRRGALQALLALVGAGVLFVPWLPSMLYQSAHTGTPWAGPVRPTALVAITLTDFGGGAITGSFAEAQLFGAVMLTLSLLAVFGAARSRRRIELDLRTVGQFRAEAAVVAGTILIAVAVMYVTGSAFASRYASTFLPIVLLLVAGGLSRFRDLRILGLALGVVLVFSALGVAYNWRTDRTQAAQIAEQVAGRAQPGDVILYCPDQLAPAALRVMPHELTHIAFPHLPGDQWPVERIDWVDYADRNSIDRASYAQAVSAHAPDRQLFVMFSGGYKTHVGTCEEVITAIGHDRGNPETLAIGQGATYYEHSGLVVFPPKVPAA
jgi:mannosyltransferase